MSNNPQELLAAVAGLIDRVVNEVIIPAQAGVTLLDDEDEPVTRVDIEAERQLSDGLRRLVPTAGGYGRAATARCSRPPAGEACGATGSLSLPVPMVRSAVDSFSTDSWIQSCRP